MPRPGKSPFRHSNQRRRPFRGPTPPNVYQTIHLGVGDGRGVSSNAVRFPARKYAAIDLLYMPHRSAPTGIDKRASSERMKSSGVDLKADNIQDGLRKIIEAGKKTRNVTWDMPSLYNATTVSSVLNMHPKV